MVPDAALGRAERDVVLHAVSGEDFDLAVVHLNGARHRDLTLGMRENLPDSGIEPQQARRSVELLEHRVEDAATCFHVTPAQWRGPGWQPSASSKRTNLLCHP